MGALEEPAWRRANAGDLGQAGAVMRGGLKRAARQKSIFGKRPQKDATEANEIAQGRRVTGARKTREKWRWIPEAAAAPSPSQVRRWEAGGGRREEGCHYLRRV